MVATIKKYRAAAVNAEPGWLNLELSVQKTIHWIHEASKAGCKLVAFPELWIPVSELILIGISECKTPADHVILSSGLSILVVACQLPRVSPTAQEVSREQSCLGLSRDAPHPPSSQRP